MKSIMTDYLKKNKISIIITLIIATIFISSITPAHSMITGFLGNGLTKTAGSVTEPVIIGLYDSIEPVFYVVGNTLVEQMIGSFSPSFDVYYQLEDPKGAENKRAEYAYNNVVKGEKTDLDFNYNPFADTDGDNIVLRIITFAQRFGIILATILTLFFLLLCIMGRAEQIRDTPIQIFVKYVIVMALIYFSKGIVMYIMDVLGDIWETLVMTSDGGAVSFYHFGQDMVVAEENAANNSFLVKLLGIPLEIELNATQVRICGLIKIFLIVKLFKQFLKLYIEIAERYFVLTIMSLLSPAVFPSIISNSSSNIMHSYIRMFISQAFLILANGVFMKIFVAVLIGGGWTYTLFGYICALAFLKFCMRLDGYMASMGLNVAQTGGGMIDACGGALATFSRAVRSLGYVERGRQNFGKSMMAAGLQRNNEALYNRGVAISRPISSIVTGESKTGSTSFAQQVNARNDSSFANMAPSKTNVSTRANMFHELDGRNPYLTPASFNISQDKFDKACASVGVNANQVSHLRNVDGSQETSHNMPTHVAMYKENEKNSRGIFNTQNGDFYGYNKFDEETQARNNDGYYPNNYITSEEFESATGVSANSFIRKSDDYGFGVQVYTAGTNEDAEKWEAKVVASHSEVFKDKNYTFVKNSDGNMIALRKMPNDKPTYTEQA